MRREKTCLTGPLEYNKTRFGRYLYFTKCSWIIIIISTMNCLICCDILLLLSAPVLPGWNLTISNETSLSFSVQWTNLTALLGSQVEHFIVLLKSNRNNNSNVFHKIVNGRERRTEMTGLLSSSQYTVEVFGTDKMGQPYRTLEARARTLNGKKIVSCVFISTLLGCIIVIFY